MFVHRVSNVAHCRFGDDDMLAAKLSAQLSIQDKGAGH